MIPEFGSAGSVEGDVCWSGQPEVRPGQRGTKESVSNVDRDMPAGPRNLGEKIRTGSRVTGQSEGNKGGRTQIKGARSKV